MTRDDRDYFLSIAEATESFQDDPDFRRITASGEIRTFNPFQPAAFEPQNAALVVRSYVQRAQQQLRAGLPRWLQRFCYSFLDRCTLTLRIRHFSSVPPEAQRTFRSAIAGIPGITSFAIEPDRSD
jgi:hypothetical protein